MGYQGPLVLLAAIGVLVLVYGWFWRHNQSNAADSPCLVLMVHSQEDLIEGLLRCFLFRCFWSNSFWRLMVVVDSFSGITLDILCRFFNNYPCQRFVFTTQEFFSDIKNQREISFISLLDIREEDDYKTALARLNSLCG